MYLNKFLTVAFVVASASLLCAASAVAQTPDRMRYWQSASIDAQEPYIREEVPPSIQVIPTPLDGPVYANAQGMTLYKWPVRALCNGSTGDRANGASN